MKRIVRLSIVILLPFFIIVNNNVFHIHSDDITCPYCGASNVTLISSTATCTQEGFASYKCNNEGAPEHSGVLAAPQPTTFRTIQPALGHNLVTTITKEATCIEKGEITHRCTRCDYFESEEIPLSDHKYEKTIRKKVTCLEDGTIDYICKYCDKKYTETVKALGHDYKETEIKEATCDEDGYILNVCKNCNEEEKSILKAIGHDVDFEITKKPTCNEDGVQSGICKNCNMKIEETIKALGHTYPNDWTIESEASIFSKGLKSKTCIICNEKIEEDIEKKPIPTSVYIGSASLASTIGIVFLARKKSIAKKVAKEVIEDTAEKELLEPSFEEKTIVTILKENDFYYSLKGQRYLKVIESDFETLKETIEENEPSLTIIDYSENNIEESLDYLKSLKEELDSPLISILVNSEQITNQSELLNQLKQDEIIKEYIDIKTNSYVILVKLVLPIMKPDLKSDETLGNIGMIADALNIPGISTIIDTYVTAREIKVTYDEGKEYGLGFADKSLIISDIASILHLDKISSVTGLVGDLDDIKSSLTSKIGANEINTTKDALSDIVEVVKDVSDN